MPDRLQVFSKARQSRTEVSMGDFSTQRIVGETRETGTGSQFNVISAWRPPDEMVVLQRPPANRGISDSAWRGLRNLMREWTSEFPEAAHRMPFPRSQGFLSEHEEQVGNVFQRALIVDALCDFNEFMDDRLRPVIDSEMRFLLGCRRLTGAGGWSYFPELRELPSDADDTAQIMQAMIRSGRKDDVGQCCDGPIAMLLSDCAHDDGSFETWIIPETADAELELQRRWVQTAWGNGPDCEVIANLLYSLWLYDSERFKEPLTKGTEFVISRQRPDGSWGSTWYHGPFYGTWVCVRLLQAIAPRSRALKTAGEFLESQQHDDGGWGYLGESDPLSTALALLALKRTADSTLKRASAASALHWLSETQRPDGAWEAAPFIRMDLGRPTGKVWQTLSYESRTITTAFVTRADLCWRKAITV